MLGEGRRGQRCERRKRYQRCSQGCIEKRDSRKSRKRIRGKKVGDDLCVGLRGAGGRVGGRRERGRK